MTPEAVDGFLPQKGIGRMSLVSRIIGTAERVPLPDLVIRAAVQRLP